MYAVILAGGGGTRLWPLSRAGRPKPFLPLVGAESLLQRTVARLAPVIEPLDVYVVTDRRYVGLVLQQLPEIPAANVIPEPVGRNTGPAVALAAVAIERPADDVMVVLPADHHIRDEEGFRDALLAAAAAAGAGDLVTLGIQPHTPETGYGYVIADADAEIDAADVAAGRALAVERFVEKPDAAVAQALLERGNAYWNAGIFVWTRGVVLALLERYAGETLAPIGAAVRGGHDLEQIYPGLSAISIDYALLEPASLDGRVSLVPIDVGWSDLGSWSALLEHVSESSPDRVTALGAAPTEDLDSEDVLVHADGGRLVVTIGLRGTIVVDTPDVVLVCAQDRAQDVKRIVDLLSESDRTEYL